MLGALNAASRVFAGFTEPETVGDVEVAGEREAVDPGRRGQSRRGVDRLVDRDVGRAPGPQPVTPGAEKVVSLAVEFVVMTKVSGCLAGFGSWMITRC